MRVLIGALVSCSLVACKPDGDGSSSSSTGGTGPVAYLEYCRALNDMMCTAPPCDLGYTFDRQRCLDSANAGCDDGNEQVEREVAAGKVRYHADKAGECVDGYRSWVAAYQVYQCNQNDPAAFGALYSAYLHSSCDNGRTTYSSPLESCSQMVEGLVPTGGACGKTSVCAGSGTWFSEPAAECDAADGGCGHCLSNQANVGERCRIPGDGGVEIRRACREGVCDESGVCVLEKPQGQPCGPGIGACSGTCLLTCRMNDGGVSGTCEQKPGDNEPCTFQTMCRKGLTCVPGVTDGGYPDYASLRCRPHAMSGQPCSFGYNYDLYEYAGYSGGISYGSHSICEDGLVCQLASGYDGTCAAIERVPTGAACDQQNAPSAVRLCSRPMDRCVSTTDGGAWTCTGLQPAGSRCGELACADGLYCAPLDDGGPGNCASRKANGSACVSSDECLAYSTCDQGTCKPQEDVEDSVPVCE